MPPSAGPLIAAAWKAPEENAVAFCSVPSGTTPGNSAAPAGKSAPGEQGRDQPFGDLAKLCDALPVVTVRGMARDEHQKRGGNELDEADEAEIERAAGQLIDLPADRDGCDLVGKFRKTARAQIEQEAALGEQVLSGRSRCGRQGAHAGNY